MSRFVAVVVAAMLSLALMLAADVASANCLQTFNVKASATITTFDWLPGAAGRSLGPINCRSFELTREAYFLSNEKLILPERLINAQQYERDVEASLARLATAEADLKTQLSQDVTLNALRITYRVLKYEFGKASALIGCFAPDATASKAICAIGVAILAEDTTAIVDGTIGKVEISSGAQNLTSKLEELKAGYRKLMQRKTSFNMSVAERQRTELFEAMCSAVRKNCL